MLCQCRYSLVADLVLDTHLPTRQESLWEIQTCQIRSKQQQHHMEHKLFPHNRNEEQQSSCLFSFLEPLQHHAAALVDLWWEAMEVFPSLNVSPSGKFQVVIDVHVAQHDCASDFLECVQHMSGMPNMESLCYRGVNM